MTWRVPCEGVRCLTSTESIGVEVFSITLTPARVCDVRATCIWSIINRTVQTAVAPRHDARSDGHTPCVTSSRVLSSSARLTGSLCEYMAHLRDQTWTKGHPLLGQRVTFFPHVAESTRADGLRVPGPARLLSRALPLPKRHAARPAHASGTLDKHSRHRRARLPSPPRWRCRDIVETFSH